MAEDTSDGSIGFVNERGETEVVLPVPVHDASLVTSLKEMRASRNRWRMVVILVFVAAIATLVRIAIQYP